MLRSLDFTNGPFSPSNCPTCGSPWSRSQTLIPVAGSIRKHSQARQIASIRAHASGYANQSFFHAGELPCLLSARRVHVPAPAPKPGDRVWVLRRNWLFLLSWCGRLRGRGGPIRKGFKERHHRSSIYPEPSHPQPVRWLSSSFASTLIRSDQEPLQGSSP